MPKPKTKRRHDGWILDEQNPRLYRGLDAEAAEWLENFNRGWQRGSLRDLGKPEPETEAERKFVSMNRSRRRRDAENIAGTLLPGDGVKNSPEDALIDAIDLKRDDIARAARLKAAAKEELRRVLHAAAQARYRLKKKRITRDQTLSEGLPPSGEALEGVPDDRQNKKKPTFRFHS